MTALFDTRSGMVEAFDALVARRYELLSKEHRLAWKKNLLKTYLVEVDGEPDQEPQSRLAAIVKPSWPDTVVLPTDDAALFQVSTPALHFMVDMLDGRFWAFHSVDSADDADNAVLQGLVQTARADSMWLPTGFLHDLLTAETPRGFSTFFDTDYFHKRSWIEADGEWRYAGPDEGESDDPARDVDREIALEQLSLRMSGTQAALMLRAVEGVPELRRHLALSRARVRHGQDSVTLAEVAFDGRMLCRGPSYLQYMDLVRRIHRPYRTWLERVQGELAFRTVDDGHGAVSLEGEPITVTFPAPLDQPDAFYGRLLSGARPFRLWGRPTRSGDDYWSGTACDLHGGGVLRLDLSAGFIRVYLQVGCCANTVLRLITNLQRAFTTQLEVRAAGEDLALRYTGDEKRNGDSTP